MKKIIFSFLNKPILVIVVSLIIAGSIGTIFYEKGKTLPESQLATATSGSISDADQSVDGSSVRHLTLGFLTAGRIQSVPVKVGDKVKKDDILATLDPESTAGAITQAKAAYDAANANYQKVVNGATSPTINVAKAAVSAAETNLKETKQQQELLVKNARRKLFSDNLVAESEDEARRNVVPAVSGAYNGEEGGEYDLYFNDFNTYQQQKVSFSGIEKGVTRRNDLPQPLGTNGLSVAFPDLPYNLQDRWTIRIPNTSGANYASNLSAYNGALQTETQATAAAEASLNQAKASLEAMVATARPEDVAAARAQVESARGTLQIAQAAYDSRIIRAPGDGSVEAVHVSPGQTAVPNAPAIELSGTSFTKDVAVMIPNRALISRDGKYFVEKKNANSVEEVEITVGISDGTNTEVISGLSAGDQVVIH